MKMTNLRVPITTRLRRGDIRISLTVTHRIALIMQYVGETHPDVILYDDTKFPAPWEGWTTYR